MFRFLENEKMTKFYNILQKQKMEFSMERFEKIKGFSTREITIKLKNCSIRVSLADAVAVSPVIREAFLVDNLLKSITIDLDLSKRDFLLLFKAACNKKSTIKSFREKLGIKNNSDNEGLTIPLDPKGNLDDVLKRLRKGKNPYSLNDTAFVAYNLFKIPNETLLTLEPECINQIFQCRLFIYNEETLLDTIAELLDAYGSDVADIIESIEPIYLTKEYLLRYKELIDMYSFPISETIKRKLIAVAKSNGNLPEKDPRRHIKTLTTITKEKYINEIKRFPYEKLEFYPDSDKDNGIFFKCRNNVSISVSSGYFGSAAPTAIICHEYAQWISENTPNQYIIITLANFYVDITSYMFRTYNGQSFPMNWKLEVFCNDKWELADEHTNDTSLMAPDTTVIFKLPRVFKKCSQFRWTQTGLNTTGDNIFCIRGLDVYGQLYKMRSRVFNL